MTISVNYNPYNRGMKNEKTFEAVINEYNERVREERNARLRARLARPCSREEFFARLDELANSVARAKEGKILLTSSPETPIIMADAR